MSQISEENHEQRGLSNTTIKSEGTGHLEGFGLTADLTDFYAGS